MIMVFWVEDKNVYVCCLVFEGIWLCLFWGMWFLCLIEDLIFVLLLLEVFKDDLEEYVWWFVVNYLNDIVKDYFDFVFGIVECWLDVFLI